MTDPAPLILAFDTAQGACTGALLRGDTLLAMRHEDMARGQAERLIGLLQTVLDDGGADWRALSHIAVGIGPGNFTGIRISVAAARGMALGLGCPAIGVSGFDALAQGAPPPQPGQSLITTIAAPRGQVYLHRLDQDAAAAASAASGAPPIQCDPDDLPDLPEGAQVIGAEAARIARRITGQALTPRYPTAEAIARVARDRLHRDHPPPAPFYLRAADAAPARDAPPALLDG